MPTFTVETEERLTTVDITDAVERHLPADADGTATVFVRHTTAAVTINEAESRLLGDFESVLTDLVPNEGWDHDRLDGNADSHVRALLIGPSVTVPITDGDLDLGTWQSVLLVECDGLQPRTVDLRV